MKSNEEVIKEFWEEDAKYKKLLIEFSGNQDALDEADWMYQNGVRVDEITRALRNGEEESLITITIGGSDEHNDSI